MSLSQKRLKKQAVELLFSLDKFIYYSKLVNIIDPEKFFRHKLGTSVKDDQLIFEEKVKHLRWYKFKQMKNIVSFHTIIIHLKNIILEWMK